jgi:hypothetical protein
LNVLCLFGSCWITSATERLISVIRIPLKKRTRSAGQSRHRVIEKQKQLNKLAKEATKILDKITDQQKTDKN